MIALGRMEEGWKGREEPGIYESKEDPPNLSLGQAGAEAGRRGWEKASSKPDRDRQYCMIL